MIDTLLSACLPFLDLPLYLCSPQSHGWFGYSVQSPKPQHKHTGGFAAAHLCCSAFTPHFQWHWEWFLWKNVIKKKYKILQPTLYRYRWLREQVFGDRPCLRQNRKWKRNASMQMHFTFQWEHECELQRGGLHHRLGSLTIPQMLLHRNGWIEFKSHVLR